MVVVTLAKGQRFYPGSAPLEGGKDLRPASSLLLAVDIDYKIPTPLIQESTTSLWYSRVSLSGKSLLI